MLKKQNQIERIRYGTLILDILKRVFYMVENVRTTVLMTHLVSILKYIVSDLLKRWPRYFLTIWKTRLRISRMRIRYMFLYFQFLKSFLNYFYNKHFLPIIIIFHHFSSNSLYKIRKSSPESFRSNNQWSSELAQHFRFLILSNIHLK